MTKTIEEVVEWLGNEVTAMENVIDRRARNLKTVPGHYGIASECTSLSNDAAHLRTLRTVLNFINGKE